MINRGKQPTTISLSLSHMQVLDRWKKETGLARTQIVELLIEEKSNLKLVQLGWRTFDFVPYITKEN